MIIFGWGRQTIKQIGVVFKQLCGHCNNEEYWVLTRMMTWFTLFFIPVFPYKIEYFLSCPICKYGFTLNHDQVNEIKPLAEANQLLIDKKISEQEYQQKIHFLNSESSDPVEVKNNKVDNQKFNYCGKCGSSLAKESKFCGNCGVSILE